MALGIPNFFSDPELRQRQDALNAEWNSLKNSVDSCMMDPVSAAAQQEFYIDFDNWRRFYESESDWTTASKHATDEWQRKLKAWVDQGLGRLCAFGSTPGAATGESPYLPGVKEPPPDAANPSLVDQLGNLAAQPFKWAEGIALKIGIGLGILVLLVLVAVVWIATRGKVQAGPGGVRVG